MPWCPICKNEYVDGITECSDCKVPLVDSLEEAAPPIITGKQQEMERLLAFLEYSKFKGIKLNHNEETDEYELYCKDKDEKKLRRASTIFYQQESLRNPSLQKKADEENPETILGDNPVADLYSGSVSNEINDSELSNEKHYVSDMNLELDDTDMNDDDSEDLHHNTSRKESLKPYQKKSDKAADFRSSGLTLIPLGIIGLIVLVCIELGFLPIHLAAPGKYLTYGVMGALFVIFIIVGFFSLRSSKKYEQDAKEEDDFIEKLKIWSKEQIDANDMLNQILKIEPDIQEELIYFKLSDMLKAKITSEYKNLDDAFLEEFIDTIYHDQFEDIIAEHYQKNE